MADSQHTQDIIPRHQWTYDGTRVLVLRCGAVGYGGFEWPTTVGAKIRVATPTRAAECDHGGFYGWPWGFGLGDGKDPDWRALWIVFAAEPEDVIPVGEKVKCCGEVEIVFVGDWAAAMAYVLPGQMAWVAHAARGVASATDDDGGAASATGNGGVASATGKRGAASATGWMGAAAAAAGESGAALTTGVRGAASATGWSGTASATGWCGAASATGDRGAASVMDWCGAASATGGRGAASAMGVRGAAFATGEYGAASATGDYGAASATGWRGVASTTGKYGTASATGGSGAASATGNGGVASATGEYGTASATGFCSLAGVTGLQGRARGGPYSVIALAWWHEREQRAEMRCARIGVGDGSDGLLKAGVWYRLDDQGEFVESA